MSLAVYVASSAPLPAIPFVRARPGFHLEPVDAPDAPVRAHVSLPHLHRAGGQEGRGVGFVKEDEDEADFDAAQDDFDALARLIRDALERGARIEIYVCWPGDEAEEADYVEDISVGALEDPEFEFKERQLLRVRAD